MAAFVGITSQASLKAYDIVTSERVVMESCLNKPILVANWSQFVDTFGNLAPGAFLPDAVYGYFANGGAACYVTSILALEEGGKVKAAEAVIPAAKGTSFKVTANIPGPQGNEIAVKVVTGEDTFTLSVASETHEGLTMKKGDASVGTVKFEAVTISDVGGASAMPVEEPTYSQAEAWNRSVQQNLSAMPRSVLVYVVSKLLMMSGWWFALT